MSRSRFGWLCSGLFLLAPVALAQATWQTVVQRPSARDAGFVYDSTRGVCVSFGGYLGDGVSSTTSIWDGVAWTVATPLHSPPPRTGCVLVDDPVRSRVLLVGGYDSGFLSQLWSWDGVDWTPVATTGPTPSSNQRTLAAIDSVRDRLVLLTEGSSYQLHELNLATGVWQAIVPAAPWPAALSAPASMVFDEGSGRVALLTTSSSSSSLGFWNGSVWTFQSPPLQGQYAGVLAYDSLGQRLLLVGGVDSPVSLRAYHGPSATWSTLASGGPLTRAHAATFDRQRGVVVLMGGVTPGGWGIDASLWEWNGAWSKRASGEPSVRRNHTIAVDQANQRLYLYGGGTDTYGDLWRLENGEWSNVVPQLQLSSPSHPGSLASTRLVFDDARSELLLLGGEAFSFQFWRQVGSGWQRITAPGPANRTNPAVAYDSVRQRVVLFGGAYTLTQFSDTWTWDGVAWTQQFPAHSPGELSSPVAAYDRARDRVVLVGAGPSTSVVETWEYDGVDWHIRTSGPVPAVSGVGMVYDEARQVVVACQQSNVANAFLRTFDWDGSGWAEVDAANPQAFRRGCALASYGGRVLAHGGYGYTLKPLLDRIELSTPSLASWSPFGGAGSTSVGSLTLAGPRNRPWLGTTVRVTLRELPQICLPGLWAGFSNESYGGQSLPLDLAALGWPGTMVRIAPEILIGMTSLGNGTAHADIAVPNLQSLLGAQLHLQALAFEPVLGALGTSNGLTMTLGAR